MAQEVILAMDPPTKSCLVGVTAITVKRLYFAGRIFREFRELAYIRENCFQRKLSASRYPYTSMIRTSRTQIAL